MTESSESVAEIKEITVIYYSDESLELKYDIKFFTKMANGRVVIPEAYKLGKSIIAVCAGAVNILNTIGDRISPATNIEHVG